MAEAYSTTRVRRSLAHFAFGKTIGIAAGLGLLLLLVRALAPADYAFYIASQALLELTAQFSSFGLLVAAQRYLPELMARGEGVALKRLSGWLVLGRAMTLLCAVALLYPMTRVLAEALGLSGYERAIQLYFMVLVFESFARYLEVIFDSLLLQGISQIGLLIRAGIRVGGLALLLWHADGPLALEHWIYVDAVAALAGTLWGAVSLFLFLGRNAHLAPGAGAKLEPRRYSRYALPLFVAASLYTGSGPNTVKLIAANLLGTLQFAAFGFASAFSAMMQRYLPVFLLIGMIRPLFVAARQRDDFERRLPFMATLVFKLNAFVLVPVIAYLAVAGRPLADLLTGGRYPDAAGFLLAFTVVLLAQAFRAVISMTAQAMESIRAPLVGTALGLLGLVAGVLLNATWPGFGLCAGLVASELLFVAWVAGSLARGGLRFSIGARGYLLMLVHGGLAAVAARAAMGVAMSLGPISALLAAAMVGAAVYLLAAFLIKPFTDEERDTLNRILKKRIFVW